MIVDCIAIPLSSLAVVEQFPTTRNHPLPHAPFIPAPFPAQERYQEYRRCMAEQQLSPVPLRDFFKHSDERGVPAL